LICRAIVKLEQATLRQADRTQKAGNQSANRPAFRSWLSTARWAIRSARLGGWLFSAKNDESRDAGAIFESIGETLEETDAVRDHNAPDASVDPSAASNVARESSVIRKSDRSSRERIVLFAPGPITEADLLREKLKCAATMRQRQRRRRRLRWLTDNAGTILLVIGLLVVAWFVAAG
jgi:hypothetical protein